MNWIGPVGVRPEATRISRRQPESGVRASTAVVQNATFLGSSVHVEARLATGETVLSELSRLDGSFCARRERPCLVARRRRTSACIMTHLRRWFLAPTASMLAVLFFAPMLHHPGVQLPDARRVRRSRSTNGRSRTMHVSSIRSTRVILLRTLLLSAAATLLCLVLGFPLALFISRAGTAKESLPAAGDASVLDQLSGPHLRVDVPAAGHRPDQFSAARRRHHSRAACRCCITTAPCLIGLVYGYLPFVVLPLYATLERLDKNLAARPPPTWARGHGRP